MFPRRLVVLDGVARGEEGHRLVSRRQQVAEGFAREPSGQGVTRLLRRRGAFSFQQPERPAVVDAPAGATGLGVDHVADLVVGAGVAVERRCAIPYDFAQTGGTIPPGVTPTSTVHPPASRWRTSTPCSTRAESVSLRNKGCPPVSLWSHPPKSSRRAVSSPPPSCSGNASDRKSRTVSLSVRGPRTTRLMGRSREKPASE